MEAEKSISVFAPVDKVFPTVQNNFQTFKVLLEELSLTDAIMWCSRINIFVSHDEVEHVKGQQEVISRFLTSQDIELLNQFVKEVGGKERVILFFAGQIVEFIRWVVRYSQDKHDDGTTFNDPEVGRNFIKALLIASDIWSQRVFANRFDSNEGKEISRKKALGAIRKSIEAQSSAPDLTRSLGRGWTLFRDYFPRFYSSFDEQFESSTGLSVEQYYISLSCIITNFMKPSLDSNIFRIENLKESGYGEVLERFIVLESLNNEDLKKGLWDMGKKQNPEEELLYYNYRTLREKPIFCTKDGRAIILDPRFFSERAMVGPLFYLVNNYPKKTNELFSAFGYAFEYYSKDILSRIFPQTEFLAKRLSCNIEISSIDGKQAEIDACLNNIQDIVIFEMKASWIIEDEILSDDYNDYLKQLRKKYGVTEGSENDRKVKGVGQLARIIKIISSEKWRKNNIDFMSVKNIYPILVVHDPFLSAPVHGEFLASEFKKYLSPDMELKSGEFIIEQLKIAPLILITIEELENLENSIEKFGFRDFLSDYSKACPDRIMSINNYIYNSAYRNKIYHNRNLASKGIELLDLTGKTVFPETYNQK